MKRLCLLSFLCCATALGFNIDGFHFGTHLNISVGGTAPPTQGPVFQTLGDATDAQGGTRQGFIWKTLGSNATEYVQVQTTNGYLSFFTSPNLTTRTLGYASLRYRGIPSNPAFTVDTTTTGGSVVSIAHSGYSTLWTNSASCDCRITDADLDTFTASVMPTAWSIEWPTSAYPSTIDWKRITDFYCIFRWGDDNFSQFYGITVLPQPSAPPAQMSNLHLILSP
jgi:hypothetical protein